MQRPSVVTIVLLAAALALAGNMATNTVQVSASWWPYLIWTLVALLVFATVAVELSHARDAVDVVRVSRLTNPIKLGVHPAAAVGSSRVPPFIARDRLPDLENALRTGGFILVVGESTAGKTRLAFEAMRRVLPRHRCVRPRAPEALPEALSLVRSRKRAVLWLDDLERFLGFHGLINLPRCVVLATMRTSERDDLSHRHDLARSPGERQSARTGRDVLNQITTEIRLDRMWSEAERARAREYTDTRIAQALAGADDHGVAELMAAGPQLLREWRDARNVRGAALVSAAVDARRAGYHRPLPSDLLRALHPGYLPRSARPEPWEAALAWATAPLHATSSLLEPVDGGFVAFDYLVDAPDTPPIPDATWAGLIRHLDPRDVVDVAWQASFLGRVEVLERAFEQLLGADHYLAASVVAVCLSDAGRTERAVELLELTLSKAEISSTVSADDLLFMRGNLAWELGERVAGQGDPARALQIARQLADDYADLRGEDHSDTLGARTTVARQIGATGHPEEALALASSIADRASAAHGNDHWTTLGARFEVAVWTRAVRGDAAGAELFLALLQQMQSIPGVNRTLFVDCMWNLGGAMLDSGNPRAAVPLLVDAVTESQLAHGVQHRRTLQIRLTHANAVGATGDRATAHELAEALAAECRDILGQDHPTTVDARAAAAHWA